MTANELRTKFLDYFKQREHVVERPDSLVPTNDPTLLFTSAGMVQFKSYWAGSVPLPYRRATTCQPCLRVSGKQNDLEEVGKTNRHMTFFEMLGNFSFGDYFKREAIHWAWEFSMKEMGFPKQSVWATVYRDDDEAYDVWHKEIGLEPDRIVKLGEKDNFWGPAGESGACGPCSELHFDKGPDVGCRRPECAPGCDCGRFIEYWNLVFPQYDQAPDGSRKPLKNRGIDTGMGLERLACLVQNVETVFDTDLLQPLMDRLETMSRVKKRDRIVPYRIVADHARAVAFLMSDGVVPSNEGRGYVLRMLLRRAARQGYTLNIEGAFLHKIVDHVITLMGDAYPDLKTRRDYINKMVLGEEERFEATLTQGLSLMEEIVDSVLKKGEKVIPGKELFRMYDTYGFPVELAADIAAERGLSVDRGGFEAEMEKQRQRARESWAGTGAKVDTETYGRILKRTGVTKFLGYDTLTHRSKLLAIVANQRESDTAREDFEAEFVLDQTPFYAEAGGQVGDSGEIKSAAATAQVMGAFSPAPGLIVHRVKVVSGAFSVGETVTAQVDPVLRQQTAIHHTATHILQSALRSVLGSHVHQAGSLVEPERLRFDYTHFEAPTPEQLDQVEGLMNQRIREDVPAQVEVMKLDDARAKGAMALFGEKYSEEVRAIGLGDFSLELCGGTHLHRTGEIGFCRIVSESSIASGIRRIEAVCGKAAEQFTRKEKQLLLDAAAGLGTSAEQLPIRAAQLVEENKRLTRELAQIKSSAALSQADELLAAKVEVDGIAVVAGQVDVEDRQHLRELIDKLKSKLSSGVVVLGASQDGGKVLLIAGVTPDLTKRIQAGKLVSELAKIVGGRGGGKPDLAEAGGKDADKLSEAIGAVASVIKKLTS